MAMNIEQATNIPITMKLNGIDYKIPRLSVREIWAVAEHKVLQDYYDSVAQIASYLKEEEKAVYRRDATKNIPRGSEMQTMRDELLGSIDGVIMILRAALNKFQQVTDDTIIDIIKTDPSGVDTAISYLTRMGDNATSSTSDSDSDVNEKKTVVP